MTRQFKCDQCAVTLGGDRLSEDWHTLDAGHLCSWKCLEAFARSRVEREVHRQGYSEGSEDERKYQYKREYEQGLKMVERSA